MTTCYGCENNISNQEGHMNGCLSETYYLYTDGACKGNPGRSGGGAVIYDSSMNEIASVSKYFGIGTNNEAEYKALIEGLKLCEENFIPTDKVTIRMDSNLVVSQVLGKFKVKNERLLSLYNKVKGYEIKTIEHVYREFNKRADELANKSL